MNKLLTETIFLPAYWASSLINGDDSGLDDADLREIKAFEAEHPYYGPCLGCTDEPEPRPYKGLLTDCLEYTFPVQVTRKSGNLEYLIYPAHKFDEPPAMAESRPDLDGERLRQKDCNLQGRLSGRAALPHLQYDLQQHRNLLDHVPGPQGDCGVAMESSHMRNWYDSLYAHIYKEAHTCAFSVHTNVYIPVPGEYKVQHIKLVLTARA